MFTWAAGGQQGGSGFRLWHWFPGGDWGSLGRGPGGSWGGCEWELRAALSSHWSPKKPPWRRRKVQGATRRASRLLLQGLLEPPSCCPAPTCPQEARELRPSLRPPHPAAWRSPLPKTHSCLSAAQWQSNCMTQADPAACALTHVHSQLHSHAHSLAHMHMPICALTRAQCTHTCTHPHPHPHLSLARAGPGVWDQSRAWGCADRGAAAWGHKQVPKDPFPRGETESGGPVPGSSAARAAPQSPP